MERERDREAGSRGGERGREEEESVKGKGRSAAEKQPQPRECGVGLGGLRSGVESAMGTCFLPNHMWTHSGSRVRVCVRAYVRVCMRITHVFA